MPASRALLPTIALVALVAAGCGVAAVDRYAGMSSSEAHIRAMAAFLDASRRPGTGLYHHRIRFVAVSKSHYPSGDDAWLVRARDLTIRRDYCVWVSGRVLAIDLFARPCARVSPPPPAPAPTTTAIPPY
jgi:hypothetical protein